MAQARYPSQRVDILRNPTVTGVVAVATPEEMPVIETGQLLERIQRETVAHVAAIVMNRMPDPVAFGDDLAVITSVLHGSNTSITPSAATKDATSLALVRRSRAEEQFRILQSFTENRYPVITQPAVLVSEPSVMVQRIADALTDEVL